MKTVAAAALLACAAGAVTAQPVIYASGQLLIPDPNGDIRENYIYEIDIASGVATPFSPATTPQPAALAGAPDGRLFGFSSGQLVEVDPATGLRTPVGGPTGLNSTGFDITTAGVGYLVPFNANFDTQQFFEIDLATGQATPVGTPSTVGDAIDTARNTPVGSATPFIISLGSVGPVVYGVDLDTNSLIAFNAADGTAAVVGDVGAVGLANGGIYSGFSALTGVDEDGNGEFDALYGSVNFLGSDRVGGLARFDLATGDWTLVGTNPGVIFFGFASVPASSLACSPADLSSPANPGTADGILTGADFFEFLVRFEAGDLTVDFSSPISPGVPDGLLTGPDFFEFLNLFAAGC